MSTKYRHLTHDEFLFKVEGLRQHSPIIDELCERLERNGVPDDDDLIKEEMVIAICPICEAQLDINVFADTNPTITLSD